jgi:hypothetical protein
LNPTNSETSQQNSGDIEALTTSGEQEISKDMISETPKPSTDVKPFIAPNMPWTPEPGPLELSNAGIARGPDSMGQVIQPATPSSVDTSEPRGQAN